MRDLERALADIVTIRTQIARGTAFRGLGATVLAVTALLPLATAAALTLALPEPTARPLAFFGAWIATAFVALTLIAIETVRRARRLHAGLADAMVTSAFESFLPAGGAGLCLGLVLARCAPEQIWMLPGLWQVLVGLGLFASARILPRGVQFAGAWYVLAGLFVLADASAAHELSPAAMGVPFAVGQAILAAVMYRHAEGIDDDA